MPKQYRQNLIKTLSGLLASPKHWAVIFDDRTVAVVGNPLGFF